MTERQRKLQLKVGFEGKPEKELAVTAFVFDHAGRLVTSAPVRAGKADLVLPGGAGHPQVVLGPSTLAEDGEPTLERLRRAGGHEPSFRLAADDRVVDLGLIPELEWHGWHHCRCRIRGRVVRPVRFGHGYSDMPVCNAIVHVCEVDRWPLVIAKLPDLVLERLREDILVAPFRPIPEPDPNPVAGRLGRDRLARVGLNPQPLPPKALEVRTHAAETHLHATAEVVPPHAALVLDATTRAVLSSESMESVRRILVDQAALFVPYICLWKYLWPWFTCDEVAVVTTDENGRFDTSIWYPCFGDRPDIYVWVEYPVNGTPTTVYRPLMACNTYWNYQCGRELTIRVTDPRVPWCGDVPRPPGSQVVIVSIGDKLGFPEIEPSGLTGANEVTLAGAPLGGSIEPVVLFGTSLPAGVSHYRWSFRQLTRSGDPSFVASASWTAISEPVGRHYEVGGIPAWYPLSTVASAQGAVVEIPPTNPPGGPSSVWRPSLAVRANNASAFFLPGLRGSAALAAGTHELKLELFKLVAGVPVRVRLDEPGAQIDLLVVDEPVPLGPSPAPYVAAPAANRLLDGGDLVGFRWVLHIDDNQCDSDIIDVVVGPNAAGPCGFIQYDPAAAPPAEATIAFRAHHPNGFATFSFVVSKGSTGPVADASAGGAVTQPMPNGFTNDGSGSFTKNVPVATLLGGCIEAAFAETNYVAATATDGWDRLSGYDDSGPTKAFALEPTDS